MNEEKSANRVLNILSSLTVCRKIENIDDPEEKRFKFDLADTFTATLSDLIQLSKFFECELEIFVDYGDNTLILKQYEKEEEQEE